MRMGIKSIETKHMEERDALFRGAEARLDRRGFLQARRRCPRGVVAGEGAADAAALPAGERRATRHAEREAARSRSRTSRTRTSTSATLNDRFVRAILQGGRRRQRARPAARLRPLRRRPRAARAARGARARRADPQEREGAREDDGRRARLVPRHGRAVARAVRRAAVLVRPQGRALRRADERQREGLLDRAKHDARCSACRPSPASTTACSRASRSAPSGRDWLKNDLAKVDKNTPLVVFSHSPLYKYYRRLELLDRRRRRGAGDPQAVRHGHRDPRPHAPAADEPHRQHLLPRHALHGVAVAVRARGPAEAHRADEPRRSVQPFDGCGDGRVRRRSPAGSSTRSTTSGTATR